MPLQHGLGFDRAGINARPAGSFEGCQPADMVKVGMGDEDALQIFRRVSQTCQVAQDLAVTAGQPGVDQGQAVRVDEQVGVGNDVGDQVNIRDDFQSLVSFG